ncbi:hypothetical protein KAR48_13555 [bacterium]|nr:hypothetical protein [bacterium]
MKVILKPKYADKKEVNDLSASVLYLVIGLEADDYRLINDNRRPYLYDHKLFDLIDEKEPSNWCNEYGDDGERYAYPPELNKSGFFEDYFDGNKKALKIFNDYLKQIKLLV